VTALRKNDAYILQDSRQTAFTDYQRLMKIEV